MTRTLPGGWLSLRGLARRVLALAGGILVWMAASAHGADTKTRLAVLDLTAGGGLQADDGKTLGSFIRDAIVRTGKIEVLDRQRMKDVLAEQNFSQAMCDSTQGLVKVGKMLDVNRVLGGQVSRFGNVWTVSLSVVDVSTAQLLGSRAVPYEGRMEDLLTVAPMLALQLLGLSDAVIGQQVAALGSNKGVRWQTYRCQSEGYSVQMPGVPKAQPRPKKDDPHTVICQVSEQEVYVVACYGGGTFAEGVAKIGVAKTLNMFRDGMLAEPGRRLRSEKEIAVVGYAGLEFIIDDTKDNTVMLTNIYIVKNRLYHLFAIVPRGTENSVSLLKFFYSFALL